MAFLPRSFLGRLVGCPQPPPDLDSSSSAQTVAPRRPYLGLLGDCPPGNLDSSSSAQAVAQTVAPRPQPCLSLLGGCPGRPVLIPHLPPQAVAPLPRPCLGFLGSCPGLGALYSSSLTKGSLFSALPSFSRPGWQRFVLIFLLC